MMWKDMDLAKFEVLSRHFSGGAEENQEEF
jgi:hypothetical protein